MKNTMTSNRKPTRSSSWSWTKKRKACLFCAVELCWIWTYWVRIGWLFRSSSLLACCRREHSRYKTETKWKMPSGTFPSLAMHRYGIFSRREAVTEKRPTVLFLGEAAADKCPAIVLGHYFVADKQLFPGIARYFIQHPSIQSVTTRCVVGSSSWG